MFYTFSRCLVIIFILIYFKELLASKAVSNIDDSYSFVALIDIVLTDGAKRTCTGTIIHDNVVITAAHCFTHERSSEIQAELTACFVVIGTKKMFDTGYEQYLPIERVLTHPKFRGWTADLALVFTFASMVSDKPGRVVPLVSDNVKAAVDANVTVISWGRSKDEETVEQIYTPPAVESDESTEQSEETTSHESLEVPVVAKRQKVRKRFKIKSKLRSKHKSNERLKKSRTRIYHERPRADAKDQYDLSEGDTVKTFSLKMDAYDFDVHRHETTTGLQGIPEISYEANNNSDFNSEEDRKIWKKTKKTLDNIMSKLDIRKHRSSYVETTHNVISYYKNNWRRKMGTQQNKLTVEIFGFVNVASCKKIIEKAKPSFYRIHNGNEMICYANEDRYVTTEDSGAPAMRHGHLVAVTVGGAEFDGDNVAVAMKISCFCSWIAENLPDGGPNMQCCTNCCDLHTQQSLELSEEKTHRYVYRKRKKIL